MEELRRFRAPAPCGAFGTEITFRYSLSKHMQVVENRARQDGKPANVGAYFPYVTEICRRSQRCKQNCIAILRLRDFLDGLKRKLLSVIQYTTISRKRKGKERSKNFFRLAFFIHTEHYILWRNGEMLFVKRCGLW